MVKVEKQEWTQPSLEVLDVSETMAGIGRTQIDWITTNDGDIYDPS